MLRDVFHEVPNWGKSLYACATNGSRLDKGPSFGLLALFNFHLCSGFLGDRHPLLGVGVLLSVHVWH